MPPYVKKREAFYLAGYDPRGTRHYHDLYKKESIKQSKINGMKIKVSNRQRIDKNIQMWKIHSSISEKGKQYTTETRYHCLEWDDIIREEWKKSTRALFMDLLYVLKIYVASGIIFKYGKTSPTQMIAAFYPVVYLFVTLFLGYFFASLLFTSLVLYVTKVPAFLISIGVGLLIVKGLITLGNRFAVFWLLRIYLFSVKYVHEESTVLEERIEVFAKYISEKIKYAKQEGIDEILIISHSVGTILTIPVLAQAFDKLAEKDTMDVQISILTLGECIPIVSFLPEAQNYRRMMASLISKKDLCWLDYTSIIDGACFPQMDYYAQSNVVVPPAQKPHFLSPRFHTLFSKEHYAALRKNRYLTHFLYLMATEYRGEYDFFKITAGHQYLCDMLSKNHHQNNKT